MSATPIMVVNGANGAMANAGEAAAAESGARPARTHYAIPHAGLACFSTCRWSTIICSNSSWNVWRDAEARTAGFAGSFGMAAEDRSEAPRARGDGDRGTIVASSVRPTQACHPGALPSIDAP